MGRAHSFEEAALHLGQALREHGNSDLAAALLELVPETAPVRDDGHRALLAERLGRVADATEVAPPLRAEAARLAEAAVRRTLRGRIGTVWITWSDCADDDSVGEDRPGWRGYIVSWQSDRADEDWCDDGPGFDDLRGALTWARARTDAVIVRPEWDESTYYWAGSGHDPRSRPPLDE